MNESMNIKKAEYLLKMMLFDPSIEAQLDVYVYSWESSRWNELVTIVLSQVCNLLEDELSELTKYLSDMGHLKIEQLSKIKIKGDRIDHSDDEATRILDIFLRKGLSKKQALRALLLICQIARGLNSNFGGKIQHYLRKYGDAILNDIPEFFSLKGSSDDEIRYIFTMWIQKVLNMPVPLRDPVVNEFCQKNNLNIPELWEAADNIDLNVAIVDELLRLESTREREYERDLVESEQSP